MGIFNKIKTAVSPTNAALVRAASDFIYATEKGRRERESEFAKAFSFVFDGNQWDAAEKLEREDSPVLTLNLSEDYTDKYLGKLFPINPRTQVLEIGVKTYEVDKAKRSKYEQEIIDVYKRSNLSAILLEQGQNFLVGGSAVLYYPQDPTTKRAMIRSVDPTRCSFLFDADGLAAAAHTEEFYNDRMTLTIRTTFWTRESYVVIEDDAVKAQGDNAMHIVPYSFIPNRPKPHGMNGRPKLRSVRGLEQDLNRRTSDWSKRVGDNTDPHLVYMSDLVKDESAVKRGRKKVTRLEKGADAKYLTVPDAEDIAAYVSDIRDAIKTKLCLVDSAGTIKSAVSGVSLAYQYNDMLDAVAYMRVFWDEGFRALNRAILTYRFGATDGDYHTDPVYHPALPQDTKAKVEEMKMMVDASLISRRDAIEELRGGEDADMKLAEILKEREQFNLSDLVENKKEQL